MLLLLLLESNHCILLLLLNPCELIETSVESCTHLLDLFQHRIKSCCSHRAVAMASKRELRKR